jgi:hypothetical protein
VNGGDAGSGQAMRGGKRERMAYIHASARHLVAYTTPHGICVADVRRPGVPLLQRKLPQDWGPTSFLTMQVCYLIAGTVWVFILSLDQSLVVIGTALISRSLHS